MRTGVLAGLVALGLGAAGAVAETNSPPSVTSVSPAASPTASPTEPAPPESVAPPRQAASPPAVPLAVTPRSTTSPDPEGQSVGPGQEGLPAGLGQEGLPAGLGQDGLPVVIRLDGVLPFVTGEVGWVALWLESAPTGSRASLSIALPDTTTTVLLRGSSNPETQVVDLNLIPQPGVPAVDALAGQLIAVQTSDQGTGPETLVGLRGSLVEQEGLWTLEAIYRSPTGEVPVSLTGWVASSSPSSLPSLSPSLSSSPSASSTAVAPGSLSATRFRVMPRAEEGPDPDLAAVLARLTQGAQARGWTLRHQPHPAGGVTLQVQGESRTMTLGLEGFEESLRWHVQTAQPTPPDAGVLITVSALDQRVGYRMEVEGVPADAAPLGVTAFPAGHGELAARRVLLTLMAAIGAQALAVP